jgi:hypothetical protein
MARQYEVRAAVQIQTEAENLIAFMLERDEEIRERLRRLAGLAQRMHESQEAARQSDFKDT